MRSVIEPTLTLLTSVRQSSGLISASIYDTAQVLRFQPELVDRETVVEWLLNKQEADGGWGHRRMPVARLVPTLACVLALRQLPPTPKTAQALQAAAGFLSALCASWPERVPDDLPVGMELLLPVLLAELRQMGELAFDARPLQPIIEIGLRRHSMLARIPLRPGSPPLHSYESLALPAHAGLLDGVGSLSHNPAATASWLKRVAKDSAAEVLGADRERARSYLARCSAGTPTPAAGIYPGVWPMNRFEQCFVLYFLAIAGAFTLPVYRHQLTVSASELARAMGPTGIGLSDHFAVDGDDTAAAIIVLSSAGLPVQRAWLDHFRHGAQYYAYPGERHGSLSLVARAMHAAILLGDDVSETAAYLQSQQQPDGSWLNDKWHASWIYVTMHAIVALAHYGDRRAVARAGAAIMRAQRPDGSWGTPEESAYALLGLTYTYYASPSDDLGWAIEAGRTWLRRLDLDRVQNPPLWIGKELYTLPRVVRSAVQAALIVVGRLDLQDKPEVIC